MAIEKITFKAPTRKLSQARESALGLNGPISGGTLESTVLALLNNARAASQLKTSTAMSRGRGKSPAARPKPQQTRTESDPTTPAKDTDPAKLASLQSLSRKLNEGLHQQGWMQVKTMRFRPKGENIDRKFVVESSLDPVDSSAVILRVRAATAAEIPKSGPRYLTTQQAAKVLNVSRPYVIGLADAGTLKGVMRTAANHRRIPESEVLRMSALMHTQMRRGIEELEELNGDQRQREIDAARKTVTRRWVAKAA